MKRFTIFSKAVLCGLLSVMVAFGIMGVASLKADKVYAETTLIYSLDFTEEQNLGKNSAQTTLADATVVNNGGVKLLQSAINGKNAISLTSTGVKQNYISLPNAILNNQSVTISYWFNIAQNSPIFSREMEYYNGSSERMIIMPYHGGAYNGYEIERNGQWLGFPGTDPDAGCNLPNPGVLMPYFDGWVLRSYVLSPEYFAVYQNGTEVKRIAGNFTASAFFGENGYFILGATELDATADFSGAFADVKVYNGVLTPSQVEEIYDADYTDYLASEYTFDNGLTDSVRNFDATAINNADVGTANKNGQEVKVLNLDGSTGVEGNNLTRTSMTVPAKTLSGLREITISMDVNVSSNTGRYGRLFEFGMTGQSYFALFVGFNTELDLRLEYTKHANVTKEVCETSNYVLPTNKWINITVAVGLNTAKIYVDGAIVAQNDNFGYNNGSLWDWGGADQHFGFGKTRYYGDAPMIMQVDRIALYATELTASQIREESKIVEQALNNLSLTTNKASIRLSEPSGIRFLTSFDLDAYNTLVNMFGQENVKLGTIIIAKDVLAENAFDLTNNAVLNVPCEVFYGMMEGKQTYTGVLAEVPAEDYATEIYAKAYVTVKDGDVEYTVYSQECVRSVYQIAKLAYNNEADTVAYQNAILKQIIDTVEQ